MIGPITLNAKQTGKRSAGKPHAAFDVAGAGNVAMVVGMRSKAKAMGLPPTPTVRACSRPYLRGGSVSNGVLLPDSDRLAERARAVIGQDP